MANYRLHCFKESGNSYKVALALSIAGLEWQKVDVDYFNGETRRPAWRAEVNEQGEVPVLEFDGQRTSAAFDIVERHLASTPYIVGQRLTVADISMAGYVFYPKEELGFDIGAEYPRIGDWMARLAEARGWRAPYAMLG